MARYRDLFQARYHFTAIDLRAPRFAPDSDDVASRHYPHYSSKGSRPITLRKCTFFTQYNSGPCARRVNEPLSRCRMLSTRFKMAVHPAAVTNAHRARLVYFSPFEIQRTRLISHTASSIKTRNSNVPTCGYEAESAIFSILMLFLIAPRLYILALTQRATSTTQKPAIKL